MVRAAVASAPDGLGERGEQAGEEHVRGRVEPEAGRTGRERVAVLRTADGAAVDDLDVDEARVLQPLEVQPHGVGVQVERVGEVAGAARRGRSGQLPVERVAGLVAEGLQHLEVHALTVDAGRAYFQGRDCFIRRPAATTLSLESSGSTP